MHRLTLLVVLLTTTSTFMIPTTAQADDSDVSEQVSYALQVAPGGVQTAWNQVTWPDGTILTVEPTTRLARAAAVASTCPSGKFCAFSDINGGGSHLDFTACPSSNSVAALPQVFSISNARSSVTVTGRKGSTVIVTVNAGATKNVTKTIDKVVCAV